MPELRINNQEANSENKALKRQLELSRQVMLVATWVEKAENRGNSVFWGFF